MEDIAPLIGDSGVKTLKRADIVETFYKMKEDASGQPLSELRFSIYDIVALKAMRSGRILTLIPYDRKSGRTDAHIVVNLEGTSSKDAEARLSGWLSENGFAEFGNVWIRKSALESGKLFLAFHESPISEDSDDTLVNSIVVSGLDHETSISAMLGTRRETLAAAKKLASCLSGETGDFIIFKFRKDMARKRKPRSL